MHRDCPAIGQSKRFVCLYVQRLVQRLTWVPWDPWDHWTQPVSIPITTAQRASRSVDLPTQTIVVLRYNGFRTVSDILLVHVHCRAPIECRFDMCVRARVGSETAKLESERNARL